MRTPAEHYDPFASHEPTPGTDSQRSLFDRPAPQSNNAAPARFPNFAQGCLDSKDSWVHETCGCEWRPRQVGPLRHWEPYEHIEVFHG